MYWKGFLKMCLAHHPVCALYQNHVIDIKGIKLCLGCTALYSGMSLAFLLVILGTFDTLSWFLLVSISFLLFLPTILRLFGSPVFSSSDKNLRFFYRFTLGGAIIIGIVSILESDTIIIQIVQFMIGVALYAGISIKRIKGKDTFAECQHCAFPRSPQCPGFRSFYVPPKKSDQLENISKVTNNHQLEM